MRPASRFVLERSGLAAAALQGVIRAERFQQTTTRVCILPSAPLRRDSGTLAEQDDQLLFGETFDMLADHSGFALGQIRRTGYVGYVPSAALGEPGDLPTHRIAAIRAYAYAEPDFKAAASGPLPMGALVAFEADEAGYARIAGAGWIPFSQLTPVGRFESDPAPVAERFLGTPYLWGGRDGLGIDCSGLVWQALSACGVACPRDTDHQAEIGRAIGSGDLRRGDLVCWTGHIGMMLDGARLIHANTFHMAVAIEPLGETIERVRARSGAGPTAFRRP